MLGAGGPDLRSSVLIIPELFDCLGHRHLRGSRQHQALNIFSLSVLDRLLRDFSCCFRDGKVIPVLAVKDRYNPVTSPWLHGECLILDKAEGSLL